MSPTHPWPLIRPAASRRRRRGRCAIWVLGSLVLGVTSAQIPDVQQTDPVIPVGPFQIYPLLRVGVERTDNVFQSSEDESPQAATISTIFPGVVAEMPFSHSHTRFGYAAQLRDHSGVTTLGERARNVNQFVLLDTLLRFASGVQLGLRDDYQSGVLDTQVLDPTNPNEVTFAGEEFRNNLAELELAHERVDRRRIGLSVRRSEQDVVRESTAEPAVRRARSRLLDWNELEVRASGQHRLTPRVQALWDVFEADTSLRRPALCLLSAAPTGNDDPICGVRPRIAAESIEQRETSGRVGIRLARAGRTTLDGRAGWSRLRSSAGDATTDVVATLEAERQLPRHARILVRLAREFYPSVYGGEHFVSNQLRLQARSTSPGRIAWGGTAAFFRNEYELGRRDDTVAAEGWIGYRFGRWLQWRLHVRADSRSSTESRFDYDVVRVGTSVGLGGR